MQVQRFHLSRAFGMLEALDPSKTWDLTGEAAFAVGGAKSAMTCELCKTVYNGTVQVGGRRLPLIDIKSPFVVLENCNDHRLHVLPVVDGTPVTIGRGQECSMSIQDTSFSRVHASIRFSGGNSPCFVLSDQSSRFGTSIKITTPMTLEVGQEFSVQVGRTILQLSTKRE